MAKPSFLGGDDEEDALSLVMGEGEELEGEEPEGAPLEGAEEVVEAEPKSDPNQVLDEVMAKLEELRGLVTSL